MNKFVANSFNIPNTVIDEVMPILSDAALRCYLVITRQTTGWQKTSDRISISQFMAKTGKSRHTVIKGCNELEKLGLITKITDENKSSEYTLNLSKICTSAKSEPVQNLQSAQEVVQNLHGGSAKSAQEVVQNLHGGSAKSAHTKNTIQKTIKNTKQKTNTREKNLAIRTLREKATNQKFVDDFLVIRKVKKAPLTETALNGIIKQAEKAGLSLDEVLEICIDRNWQTFRAGWNWQDTPRGNHSGTHKENNISTEFEDWVSPHLTQATQGESQTQPQQAQTAQGGGYGTYY